jgi:2',3'-cyclic-nucleotide 2'-phosphodiesterase (5'-nucleotidase family)
MSLPLALLAALTLAQARPAADTVTLVIAATTDVHGRVMDWDYERDTTAPLGLVRAATVLDSLRRAHPGRVLLFDAGDLIQGNPFGTYWARVGRWTDHPIVAALNAMQYTAAVPGNHEFNFGLPLMQRALGTARFPWVSANMINLATGRTVLPPWILLDVAGVRVGVTGATTPGVLVWDRPHVSGLLDFREVAEAVPPAVREMRQAGAELTILVAHAGLDGVSSYPESVAPREENVGEAIRRSGELDVVVIGHSHREIADSAVHGALVIQPRNWVQSLAVAEVRMVREAGRWRVATKHGRIIPLRDVPPLPALVEALRPAHEEVLRWVTRPLGTATEAMPAARSRLVDTPVIDFINHVQRAHTGAQLSSTAAFNPRGGIPRGPVTIGDLASIYPYDNTLRVIRISGADLRAYLEYATRFYRGIVNGRPVVNESIPGYNFDIISGADYELDLSRPMGERVVRLVVAGRPVAPADSLTLALNNYRQQGGGGFVMLSRAPVIYDRQESIRDLLADYVERAGTLRPSDFFVRNWLIRGLADPGPDRPGN